MKRKGLKPSTVLKWPLATIAYVKWGEIAFHRKRLSYKNNVLLNSFWKESKNTRSLLFHNNPCQFFSLLQRPGLFVSNCFDPFKWIIGKNNNSFLSKYFLPRHLVFKKAFQMDHKKTFKMSIKINWVGELSWQSSSEIVLLLFVSFRERENEKKWNELHIFWEQVFVEQWRDELKSRLLFGHTWIRLLCFSLVFGFGRKTSTERKRDSLVEKKREVDSWRKS